MKINRTKLEKWIKDYNPSCSICGGKEWNVDDHGVAFQDPGNTDLQLAVVNLTCGSCGNMVLVNDKELFQ